MSTFVRKMSRPFSASVVLVAAVGCSVIATSPAPQCANTNDCFVKFGAGYECSEGACVKPQGAQTQLNSSVNDLTTCRSNQECVSVRGANWICSRDRNDAEKKGVCTTLVPSPACQVYGDATSDDAILIGAMIPSGDKDKALGDDVRQGIQASLVGWDKVRRDLQATTGSAPPRPVVVVACDETVQKDISIFFSTTLNVALVIGPGVARGVGASGTDNEGTAAISSGFANADIVQIGATPIQRVNVATTKQTFLWTLAGTLDKYAARIRQEANSSSFYVQKSTDAYAPLAAAIGTTNTFDTVVPAGTLVVTDPGALPKDALQGRSGFILAPGSSPTVLRQVGAASMRVIRPRRSMVDPGTAIKAFDVKSFGASAAYDAMYLAQAAIAKVDPAIGPDLVRGETLLAALRAVVTPAGSPTAVTAVPASLSALLTATRSEAGIALEGLSGALSGAGVFTDQDRNVTLEVCTLTPMGEIATCN